MKWFTSYERRNPDTVSGEVLIVTQRYTTFDVNEMDNFEEILRQTIGSGLMQELKAEGKERE